MKYKIMQINVLPGGPLSLIDPVLLVQEET